ncbi:unnamed protein product [Miscanthus lutarioriparius]|uniref:C2H2-type domain-containing protein n=1 Tax=Miscanthus lutarioriparius TaxID=422564 RepID=A0A811Q8U1_9POAL|nr:unnamed protein product [Miscanthus lutarioriparius]CAD6252517.1 unnamed protein product [Miscanthus lutarioriparius]
MERLINHLHGPSCFDGDDVFLTLSCGSSSSCCSSEAAPAAGTPPANSPPPCVLRGRRRRRRGKQQASSSFDCRTCGREFPTFQALGGHRTSHLRRPTTTKKKTRSSKAVLVHACAACGLGFSTGQALGGHRRRHRGGPSTTATEEEVGCGGPAAAGCVVGLARVVVPDERPSSAQLLDLFV